MKLSEFTAEECPLTEELVRSAYDELERYDIGGDSIYSIWARRIVERAQAQGVIWTKA